MRAINYQHLRYFWTVFRHQSLTRASAELCLTPQTVSTQIRDLEESFELKLYEKRGRNLALTDTGQIVFGYAERIFNLGKELQDVLRGLPTDRPLEVVIGVSEVMPKIIAHHLIEPIIKTKKPTRIICREGKLSDLLSDLAVHNLDVVLSDAPIPSTVKVKAFNHLLGKCGITFMAQNRLASTLRDNFPDSLNGQPYLAPVRGTVLRQNLDEWFEKQGVFPNIVGEFDDSALLKVFGQTGAGFFPIPSVIEKEVSRQYLVEKIAVAKGVYESFYAISVERQIKNSAISAICENSRAKIFKSDKSTNS